MLAARTEPRVSVGADRDNYLDNIKVINRRDAMLQFSIFSVLMDHYFDEAAEWAEEYYSQKVKQIEESTWPLNAELLKLWNSLTDSERKNPHWADDILSQQPNTGLVPPLVPVKDCHLLFRTPNGSSMYITLEDRTPMEQITRKPYKSVKDWREQLNARMADRDRLHKIVDENIKELGLENIPRQDLILE